MGLCCYFLTERLAPEIYTRSFTNYTDNLIEVLIVLILQANTHSCRPRRIKLTRNVEKRLRMRKDWVWFWFSPDSMTKLTRVKNALLDILKPMSDDFTNFLSHILCSVRCATGNSLGCWCPGLKVSY